MVTGYWISKTLMTAVELEVFTKLSGNKTVTFEQLQNDILDMGDFLHSNLRWHDEKRNTNCRINPIRI
jgi:hypothetical protein